MENRSWEKHWERFEAVDFLRTHEQFTHPSRFMIADEAAKIGGTVLECGSATCIDYPLYKERGLRYSAIDITPKYIARAKELYPEIDARAASVLNLPFPDTSFNTAYCRALLEHLHPKEWPIAVREMWRVTRRQMIICLYQKPIKGHMRWETGGDALDLPASFIVNNPGPRQVQTSEKAVDLEVEFNRNGRIISIHRGNDGPPEERRIVFAVPIPEGNLLELIKGLPQAGLHRYLESPQDGRHKVHYLYIISKMTA